MLIYFSLLAMPLLMGLICFGKKMRGARNIYLFLNFSVLTAFMALRANTVGTDNPTTMRIFYTEAQAPWFQINELYIGWSLLCKIVYLAFGTYRAFQWIISILISFCVAAFINKFSSNVILSTYLYIALYFYCFSFNAERQMTALALILGSVCLLSKKIRWGWSLVVLACTIHNTAIFSLPIMWLLYVKKKRLGLTKMLLVSSLVICTGSVFYITLVRIFASWFPHYEMYLEYETQSGGRILLVTLAYSIYVIWGMMLIPKGDRQSNLYISLLVGIFAIILGFAGTFNTLLSRINYYYTIFLICMIPNVISATKRGRAIMYLTTVSIFAVPYAIQINGNYSGVVPYQFFWN